MCVNTQEFGEVVGGLGVGGDSLIGYVYLCEV